MSLLPKPFKRLRVLAAIGACAWVLAMPGSTLAAQVAPKAQMSAFLDAIRASDVRAFATFFSNSAPWRYVLNYSGIEGDSREVSVVTPAQLRRDLATRGQYYSYFMNPQNQGVGSVGYYVALGGSWQLAAGNKFVPPGGDPTGDAASSLTWVRWRLENGRWVIDEIGEWYH